MARAKKLPTMDNAALDGVRRAHQALESVIRSLEEPQLSRRQLASSLGLVLQDLRKLSSAQIQTAGGTVLVDAAPVSAPAKRSVKEAWVQSALDFKADGGGPDRATAVQSKPKTTFDERQRHALRTIEMFQRTKVDARAGAGKTTLLVGAAERLSGRGIYVAYNADVARDTQVRMPHRVAVRTGHALAYASVGLECKSAGKQIRSFSIPEVRKMLDLEDSELSLAYAARETLDAFLTTPDDVLTSEHIPGGVRRRLLRAQRADLASTSSTDDRMEGITSRIVEGAQELWRKSSDLHSSAPISHDGYFRLWWARRPTLQCDFLMLDEAQDSTRIMQDLIAAQQVRTIVVGDRWQSLYAWRGAVNALDRMGGEVCTLTHSYRFGTVLAEAGNAVLRVLGERHLAVGAARDPGVIGAVDMREPFAHLCRTTAGLCLRAAALAPRMKTAIVGGGQEIVALMTSALALFSGRVGDIKHPLLKPFRSYSHLKDYVSKTGDQECALVVRLCDEYGAGLGTIINVLHTQLVGPDDAHALLSTLHKAKGREWNQVVLDDDFRTVFDHNGALNREEACVLYVAATRARKVLQPNAMLQSLMAGTTGLVAIKRMQGIVRDRVRQASGRAMQ